MKQYINKHKYWLLGILISSSAYLISNRSSAKGVSFIVALFLVIIEGCCIHTELKKHNNKLNKILCKVLEVLGILFLLIGISPLIIIPTLAIVTAESTNFLVIVCSGWIIFLVFGLLSCITLKIFSKSNYYRLILILRYLFHISKTTLLIISSILLLIVMIFGLGLVIDPEITNDLNPYLSSFLFVSVFVNEFFLYFAIPGTVKFFKSQTMLFLKRSATIVYLRSFTIDQTDLDVTILKQLTSFKDKNCCHLLKVGNPNELFAPVPYTTYYLPTTNWKKSVSKLIRFAKVIFVVMGSSEGLCWEILQHKEYWDKYIFYIPNEDVLHYWIELSNNSNHTLNDVLHRLESQISEKGVSFYIKGEWLCFSSDIYRIVDAHENSRYSGVCYCKLDNILANV